MTLEKHINLKKRQYPDHDVADINDWTNDWKVEQQFLGFQDSQIVEFRAELEKNIDAMNKKLDDTDRELSRRKAKKFANNLLDNLFSVDIKRLNNLSIRK